MELAYWLAVCIATGLLGVCVRRHEIDESLLCGLLISGLILLVAIKKGFVGMDATAIPIAMTAASMFGYASYGIYEQNKEEAAAVDECPDGVMSGEGSSCMERRMTSDAREEE